MNTSELQAKIQKLGKARIVTSPRGSWKWQDAYKVSYYHAFLADNGKVVWKSFNHSIKYSWPQLRERGYPDKYEMGSLQNVCVNRRDAVRFFGISFVRMIENRGWKFAE